MKNRFWVPGYLADCTTFGYCLSVQAECAHKMVQTEKVTAMHAKVTSLNPARPMMPTLKGRRGRADSFSGVTIVMHMAFLKGSIP